MPVVSEENLKMSEDRKALKLPGVRYEDEEETLSKKD